MKTLITFTLWAVSVVTGTGVAAATDISGTITTTLTITEDSQLVGDVTCLAAGPCIAFGAPGITLNLNGHTMIGQGARDACPSLAAETGVSTNGQDTVTVTGPGLISRFRQYAILVSGNSSQITGLVVASTCLAGVRVDGNANTVADSTVVRASLFNGANNGGIMVLGDGGHSIQRNGLFGASNVSATTSGHGIYVQSTNNLIDSNNASGNPGAGLFLNTGATGNTVQFNTAFGNVRFQDIFDSNAAGANTYQGNACEVSGGTGAPTCPAFR